MVCRYIFGNATRARKDQNEKASGIWTPERFDRDQLKNTYGGGKSVDWSSWHIYVSLRISATTQTRHWKSADKVEMINSRGMKNIKTNDSLIDLQKASAQMIKIRQQLHLDEPAAETDDLEDEMWVYRWLPYADRPQTSKKQARKW